MEQDCCRCRHGRIPLSRELPGVEFEREVLASHWEGVQATDRLREDDRTTPTAPVPNARRNRDMDVDRSLDDGFSI